MAFFRGVCLGAVVHLCLFFALLWMQRERLTLIVEAIDSVDGGTLVVAPEQEEVLRILDLVGQQQADGLQGLFPPVYVVAQEQVVALRRKAPVLEEPKQVVVLPVDVTCRGDRCDEMEDR